MATRATSTWRRLWLALAEAQGGTSGKELIVATAAGFYLLWERWRRLRERAHAQEIGGSSKPHPFLCHHGALLAGRDGNRIGRGHPEGFGNRRNRRVPDRPASPYRRRSPPGRRT